jgi:hypothetical protein
VALQKFCLPAARFSAHSSPVAEGKGMAFVLLAREYWLVSRDPSWLQLGSDRRRPTKRRWRCGIGVTLFSGRVCQFTTRPQPVSRVRFFGESRLVPSRDALPHLAFAPRPASVASQK